MKSLSNPIDREQLRERLLKVAPDSQRRWGRMSAHQMICHLTDSFKAGTGDKRVGASGNVSHRSVLRWLALYVPVPWPHGVPTRPEMSQEIGGTKPVEFEQDRAELLAIIERFSRSQRDFDWHPHPLFGLMADRDWFRWATCTSIIICANSAFDAVRHALACRFCDKLKFVGQIATQSWRYNGECKSSLRYRTVGQIAKHTLEMGHPLCCCYCCDLCRGDWHSKTQHKRITHRLK